MKKFSKIVLGTAAVFGVLGCGFTVAGAAMGASVEEMKYEGSNMQKAVNRMVRMVDHWDEDDDWDDDWDDDDWDEKQAVPSGDSGTYEFDSISSMDIELNYDELILRESEDRKITVTVDGDAADRVRVSTEGSELQIENKDDYRPEERTVTITYPAGTEFTEVSIDIDKGTAALEDDLKAGEFSVSVGAGTLENYGIVTAGQTDIEVGVGTVELTDLDADYIEAECGVGMMSLDVAGRKEDYNYRISCGVGSVLLGEDEFTGLGSTKKVDNNGASRKMQLECGMGTLEVDFEE
ncbi:DUF2807 domain-containing protein [Blautia sp.]|uniref:GIN domain-containing protein n=1 Tax=Blautia sp. TaxID=1955243 RepID=UPI00280A611B|nr:DUF2807 domain-containing protein [Blautia sp.]MED9881171.1 DUF2807 domain-containing protein [Blautia sp.]